MRAIFLALVFLGIFNFVPGLPTSDRVAWADEAYECPMHCEGKKTYSKPGKCPVCGMPLEKVKAAGAAPNSLDYRMDFKAEPESPEVNTSVKLEFTPRRTSDNSIAKLEIDHEKPMHLVVVSQDLNWFQHVHPILQPDGSLSLPFTFPSAGNYVLFADFTPVGGTHQTFPFPLQVTGWKRPTVALSENLKQTWKKDDYSATVKVTPGTPTKFVYTLKYKGKPIKDLGQYLGATGHLVAISEDTLTYVHQHASGTGHVHGGGHDAHAEHAAPPAKAGPDVTFDVTFPKPGLYKTWAQFNHKGNLLTVDYVLRVK